MSPRFPVGEAPDPSLVHLIEGTLSSMYSGPTPYEWTRDGQLQGPYAALLYSPTMISHFFDIGKACYDPSLLQPRHRELAILALCSIYNVSYVRYAHRAAAARVGLSSEQYDTGLAGQAPKELDDKEAMVYELGRVLATSTGQIDQLQWQKALKHLSKSEITGIVHIVGGYKWVAMLAQINDDFVGKEAIGTPHAASSTEIPHVGR